MTRILEKFAGLVENDRAATAIEYGLIVSLIAIACVGAMNGFAGKLSEMWGYVVDVSQSVM